MKWIKYLPIPFVCVPIIYIGVIIYQQSKSGTVQRDDNRVKVQQQVQNSSRVFGLPSIKKVDISGNEIARYKFVGVIDKPVSKTGDWYNFGVIIHLPNREPASIKFITSGTLLSTAIRKVSDSQIAYAIGIFNGLGKPIYSLPDDGFVKDVDKEIIVGREVEVAVWFYPKEVIDKMPEGCCSLEYRRAITQLTSITYLNRAGDIYTKLIENQHLTNQLIELPVAGIEIVTN